MQKKQSLKSRYNFIITYLYFILDFNKNTPIILAREN
jgi:hypothetical protein